MSFAVKSLLALCLLTLVAACDQGESMDMDMGMVMEEEPMQKM
ncbi:MAG: hypothetical protein OXH76_04325 [Boseongicola sp.]|nr:hypothetical protein [Boseongicola sp.]